MSTTSSNALQCERVERAALEDLYEAAPPALRNALGLQLRAYGSCRAFIAAGLPPTAIVVNRVMGLGLEAPATRDIVREIVAAYRDAGVERYFVNRHPDAEPPEMADWLREAGLERARGWQQFERDAAPAPAASTDLTVRRIEPGEGEMFARIACDAFDFGEAAVPWVAALAGRERWHLFMSFDGDEPAGTGALFVHDGFGWTDFGATAPRFRSRGSQAALLAARIDHAVSLGCRGLFTCTGEEVPGDPQHSYKNILRAGFRETCLKQNYAPPRR
jgi:GNAT superfamily N-acetyltransferase